MPWTSPQTLPAVWVLGAGCWEALPRGKTPFKHSSSDWQDKIRRAPEDLEQEAQRVEILRAREEEGKKMGDAYLRTGRGGAGNLYSQKDIEDAAAKDRTEDPEAQKRPQQDSNTTASSTTTTTTTGALSRSGRGGAGNFAAAAPAPVSPPLTPTMPSLTGMVSPYASSSSSATGTKYSGRGGAGNWGDSSEGAQRARAEQDQRRKEALDAGIAREIRASLPQPPRTYHLHEPGRGRRPEV
ncbi:hypothetical protein GGS24DRAFT_514607 [Hypoxylon argillaceum]|nr:hypothetical protein GGS24DRAFT_514607 [Hypoxylon argillaceum]